MTLAPLTVIIAILLFAATGYVIGGGLYLALLVLASRRYRPAQPLPFPVIPFVVLVPAHNEGAVIRQTIAALLALDYPDALIQRIVIADNCVDDTAALAAGAGIAVWERSDPDHPGKGPALRWAIDRLLNPPGEGAIAFLDADSTVSPGWLRQCDAYLRQGAEAVQSFYTIREDAGSWRSRLLTVALLLFNHVRSAGRSTLGWSASLKGNGMVLSRSLLRRVPWDAYSITEDLEYASMLAAQDVRVAYDGGTTVVGLPGLGRAAQTQRLRWEGGRFAVIRRWAGPLLRTALRRRSGAALDAALELLVLPLALIVIIMTGATALGAAAMVGGLSPAWSVVPVLLAWGLLLGDVLGGLWAARAPRHMYRALALAPAYVAWKLLVYLGLLFKRQGGAWVRTERPNSST